LWLCLLPALLVAAPATAQVLNEFNASLTGADIYEFAEVFGAPNTDYSNLTILEIEGDSTSATGTIDGVVPVGTTDASGYWWSGYLDNEFENGTISLLLVDGFTGVGGEDIDTDDDGVIDTVFWTAIVDDIGVNDGGDGDLNYSSVVLGVSYDGLPFAPGGASRIPNGVDTDTVGDWTRNDFDGAGIPDLDPGTPVEGEAFNTPNAENAAVPVVVADPIVNEFVANHTGTDFYEFAEVFGDPNTDYSAYTILEIEGDGTSSTGTIDGVVPVGTTDANGYWWSGYLDNEFENGTISLLLVLGFTGVGGEDIDTDDDGVIDTVFWTAIVDDIGVNDGGDGDLNYSSVVLGVSYDGLPFAPGGASRIPNGIDTDTVDDWTRNDFDGAGIPDLDPGTPDPGEAFNTPNAPNEAVPILAAEPIVNEFNANHTGTDFYEFVEIFGDPDTDYSTYTILEIEGDGTSSTGTIDGVLPVGTTDANGYWWTGYLDNELENGTITLLLVEGFTGVAGDDIDTDDNGIIDNILWNTIVDDVGVNDGGAGDLNYSTVVLTPGYDGFPFTPGGASRIPNGTDTDTVADWTRNDFDGAGIPDLDPGTPDPGEAFNTPNAENALVPIPVVIALNELRRDQPSSDNDEYFELVGPEGASLDGLTFLVIGDGTGGSGVIEAVVDLTGQTIAAGSGGFFLAAEATFTLGGVTPDFITDINFENTDNITCLLVRDFTGANGDDLDLEDDCILDITPWSEIVDEVALVGPDPGDCIYSTVIVGPDGTFHPGHVYRCGDGVGDWAIGAFDPVGGNDTPRAPNPGPPIIATQPSNQVAFDGGTATFNVVASDALGYQWRKDGFDLVDGGNISGATTDTLVIDPVSFADEGTYDVVITGLCADVTSDGATLTIVDVPDIVINEIRTDQSGTDNDEYFELSGIPGTSLDGVYYLVIGDGTGVSGVIETVVDLTGSLIPADGHFLCVEDTFTLPCADVPDLIVPTNGLNFENGDNVTHLIVFGFTGALGDDLDLDDDCVLDILPWAEVIDDVSLIIDPIGGECYYSSNVVGPDGSFAPGHAYRCPDTMGGWQIGTFPTCEQDESPGFANPACILTDPADANVCEGDPVSFSVVASGVGTLTYQWRKDGIDLVDGGSVSGATTDTLTIDPVLVTDAGAYTCVVTDDNSSVESGPAVLTVDALYAVRAGNVNGGAGTVTDVLFLNGGTGSDPERKVVINSASDPFLLFIANPPSRPQARYVVYLWRAIPDCDTIETLPESTGAIALPTPLTGNAPQPVRIAKSFPNRPSLGADNWFGPWSPVEVAPYILVDIPGGGITKSGFSFYLQGLIHDPGAPNGKTGVTNGLLVELQ
jgi:hypothetical protein